jgi:hypothetical protein
MISNNLLSLNLKAIVPNDSTYDTVSAVISSKMFTEILLYFSS